MAAHPCSLDANAAVALAVAALLRGNSPRRNRPPTRRCSLARTRAAVGSPPPCWRCAPPPPPLPPQAEPEPSLHGRRRLPPPDRHNAARCSPPLAEVALLFRQQPVHGGAEGELTAGTCSDPADPQYLQHVLGGMDKACEHCGALRWAEERLAGRGSSLANPKFGNCCKGGKPPNLLKMLYDGTHEASEHFLPHIRPYNCKLSMASTGMLKEKVGQARLPPGVCNYKYHGRMYYLIGPLQCGDGGIPAFAQLYIHDTDMDGPPNAAVRGGIVAALRATMRQCNPYARAISGVADWAKQNGVEVADLLLRIDEAGTPSYDSHPGRFTAPTASEVAAIVPDGQGHAARQIVFYGHDDRVNFIDSRNAAYMPLAYALLFADGRAGWRLGLTMENGKTLTPATFYTFNMFQRACQSDHLARARRLFQEYACDAHSLVEEDKLTFLRFHQAQLRADTYSGLQDAFLRGDTASDVGRTVILPSTYVGSPRYYHQLFQDIMAVVAKLGKPDLFVTFTCNPDWPEIRAELLGRQSPMDRPDLCARVFRMKLGALCDMLFKDHVLGKPIARCHVIEFQKRGLPHAHMLIILDAADRPNGAPDIDLIVCAELPDPESEDPAERALHETITKMMMHGPCCLPGVPNKPCEKDGSCSKHYPKIFCPVTYIDDSGEVHYRRRDDGRVFMKTLRGRGECQFPMDNCWVVPHNRALSLMFNAHINVEVATSIRCVKYLYKYIYKGPDAVSYRVDAATGARVAAPVDADEIRRFLQGRYVSSSEAFWRLFGFVMHATAPNIVRLQVHLPSQNLVVFPADLPPSALLDNLRKTTLTEFLALCAREGDATADLRYADVADRYVWDAKRKSWGERQRAPDGGLSSVGRWGW